MRGAERLEQAITIRLIPLMEKLLGGLALELRELNKELRNLRKVLVRRVLAWQKTKD